MLTAQSNSGEVAAKEVGKDNGPFFCPGCKARVQLKKGRIKAHHFAHLADMGCQWGQGEGEVHRRHKEEISASLLQYPQVSDLQQERRGLKRVYPDISFRWKRSKIVIEVQVSPISDAIASHRVQVYTELSIALLWILPWNESLIHEGRYRPKPWELYLHALDYGIVFYWSPELQLQPVRYQSITPTGEPFHWNKDKDNWMSTGKLQPSKEKVLYLYPPVDFADLIVVTHPARQLSSLSLPKARLWTLTPYHRNRRDLT